jgi:hypothetical protein
MTLEEAIEQLEEIRKKSDADMPLRLVIKRGDLGQQYECLDII